MPVEFKDYYAVLGVPRDASQDDIKKAFRALARKYHPDIAKDKKVAEQKFKEINEANEVLGDPDKRRKYDELGAAWQSGAYASAGGPGQARWSAPGGGDDYEFHFGGTGFSDFFEQFFGTAPRHSNFDNLFRHAQHGMADGERAAEEDADLEGEILVTLDEVIHGSVRNVTLRRRNPRNGAGEVESFQVRIPPGAQDGRRLRIPGKGRPSAKGGEPGNLYLRVRVANHPDFRIEGHDLYHDLELAPWEAVLGAELVVPTPGGKIKLRVPAGTNSGHRFRVRGQGVPRGAGGARGDLFVVARVQVPTVTGPHDRALWEQLAKASHFNPRG